MLYTSFTLEKKPITKKSEIKSLAIKYMDHECPKFKPPLLWDPSDVEIVSK
jgi:hypothetical protein